VSKEDIPATFFRHYPAYKSGGLNISELARVCDYLDYTDISTHSFRKWYATEIYKNNGMILPLCKGCCSIAAPLPRSGISASNRNE